MSRGRTFLLSSFQLLAAVVAFPSFYCVISFFAAKTPEQAALNGSAPIPSGWPAGVMNHGQYYRWWTVDQRPVFFAICLVTLISSIGFLYYSVWPEIVERFTTPSRFKSINPLQEKEQLPPSHTPQN